MFKVSENHQVLRHFLMDEKHFEHRRNMQEASFLHSSMVHYSEHKMVLHRSSAIDPYAGRAYPIITVQRRM